jgi:hypothetical protein
MRLPLQFFYPPLSSVHCGLPQGYNKDLLALVTPGFTSSFSVYGNTNAFGKEKGRFTKGDT